MSQPTVTVLMSVYNGEKYLREAVDSILDQTYRDFEFLIIEDGSRDGTAEILGSYDDPRMRIVYNEENIGLTRSLNKGLKLARGEYIARMDADDVSLPERLERQVEFLDAHPEVGVVGTAAFRVDERGRALAMPPVVTESKAIRKGLARGNQFVHGSVLMRRERVDAAGQYREEFEYTQDYDLWLRLSERYETANLAEPLYKLRIDVKALSAAKQPEQNVYARLARELSKQRAQGDSDVLQRGQREEFERIMRDLRSARAPQARVEVAQAYYYLGSLFYRGCDYVSAIRLLWRSLVAHPRQQGTISLIVKCIIGLLVLQPLAVVQHWLRRGGGGVVGEG